MTLTSIALMLIALNVVFLLWAVFRLDRRTRKLQSYVAALEEGLSVQSSISSVQESRIDTLEAKAK
jgi:hypothetical protein